MPGTPSTPPMARPPHPRAVGAGTLLLAALLVLAASCAGQGTGQGADAQHSGGSAPPAGTARPTPTAASTPPPTVPSGCGGAVLSIQAGRQPAPVCLHVGESLTITAPQSAAQRWQPLVPSDPAVLACTAQPGDQGALTTVCRALKSGTVTVSTTTAPFSGDPHGPAQYTWTLTVHVQPAR